HRQNQLHRPHAADFLRLVHGFFDCLRPHWLDDRRHRLALHQGHGHLGHQHPHRLGLRHREFRLVDRYRPRRDAHFGHPVPLEPEVAHLDQPICRSHYALCGGLRGPFPAVKRPAQIIYGMLSMGWRGSARHWHRYQSAYLLLAGLATPLVLSVHTVVSFDFAIAIVPGWHTTIFPPYFVAGAIYSGFAMV